ncbi:MAG: hypothetical protein ACR2PM_06875 [Hyphomicrobiales bacterium]
MATGTSPGNEITSREYKMMLHVEPFLGGAGRRADAVEHCWRMFAALLKAENLKTVGMLTPGKAKKQRFVRFYDTGGRALRRDFGLVFRLRRPQKQNSRWAATLKSRTGDRIQATRYNLRPRKAASGKAKFEEDIKTPFGSRQASFMALYSQSATAKTSEPGVPAVLGDCLETFKGSPQLDALDLSAPVRLVGDFEAKEFLFDGAEIVLTPKVRAECAVIVWTRKGGDRHRPIVAEMSFRYKTDGKDARVDVARNAWTAFKTLYGARNWVNPQSRTKTAFAYGFAAR